MSLSTMKIIGIDKILDEMKEDLVYPELLIGKLYWILPKKVQTPTGSSRGKIWPRILDRQISTNSKKFLLY